MELQHRSSMGHIVCVLSRFLRRKIVPSVSQTKALACNRKRRRASFPDHDEPGLFTAVETTSEKGKTACGRLFRSRSRRIGRTTLSRHPSLCNRSENRAIVAHEPSIAKRSCERTQKDFTFRVLLSGTAATAVLKSLSVVMVMAIISTAALSSFLLFPASSLVSAVRVEFAADFTTKPSMGYLRKCYEVKNDEDGWNLEKIENPDQYLATQQEAYDIQRNQYSEGRLELGKTVQLVPAGRTEGGAEGVAGSPSESTSGSISSSHQGEHQSPVVLESRSVYVPPKLPDAFLPAERRTESSAAGVQVIADGSIKAASATHSTTTRATASTPEAESKVKSELLYPSNPLKQVPEHMQKDIETLLDMHRKQNRSLCCEDFNSCCDGSIPGSLPLATWNHVRAFHDSFHVRELLDSTPRMLERHYTFYNLMSKHPHGWGTIATPEKLLQLEDGQGMWFVDCIFGALTILLNALPAIEFEDGLATAQQIYIGSVQLLQTIAPHRLLANWTIPLAPVLRPLKLPSAMSAVHASITTANHAGAAPFAVLLGLGKYDDWGYSSKDDITPAGGPQVLSERLPCFGTNLKIYIHKTFEYERGGLFCSAGQWGIEVVLHRFLMNSSCRTDDPKTADLFFVPDYRACHYHLTPKKFGQQGLTTKAHLPEYENAAEEERQDPHSIIILNHKNKTRDYDEADSLFKNLISSYLQPWFNRNAGTDHIFVFSDQGFIVNFTHTFPEWREHIPHSIFLTTEAFTPGYGPSCFSPWKDWVVPGHLDEYRIAEIRKYNLPSKERTLLFSFHGRTGNNHDYYKQVKVRIDIEKYFTNKPNTSIGDFTPNYFEIIGKSHFCLIPEGTSSWTNHLYTAFFAGCIPLILSDKFILPFHNQINWKRISVRWPQNEVNDELYYWVLEYVEGHFEELEKTKRLIDEHQCWFDWYDFEKVSTCSPYKAIFENLASRKKVQYKNKFGWIGHEGDGERLPI
ncbi:unnamed protein product [Amoebophrya sp. A120]|nr:unnamed protein product [Amoebophrya sp. A120]|eukprot:GSA120T00012609001.1